MGTNGASDSSFDGFDVAALLRDRDYIKAVMQSCPVAVARKVLDILDDLRETRRAGPPPPDDVPSMTLAEMRQEIAWRLDTLPPADAAAIVRLLRQVAPQDGQAASGSQ